MTISDISLSELVGLHWSDSSRPPSPPITEKTLCLETLWSNILDGQHVSFEQIDMATHDLFKQELFSLHFEQNVGPIRVYVQPEEEGHTYCLPFMGLVVGRHYDTWLPDFGLDIPQVKSKWFGQIETIKTKYLQFSKKTQDIRVPDLFPQIMLKKIECDQIESYGFSTRHSPALVQAVEYQRDQGNSVFWLPRSAIHPISERNFMNKRL